MSIVAKLSGLNFYQKFLIAILFLGFVIRMSGISYGLPLWLVDDEQPFILAALKMLQLQTMLPGLHAAEFEKILYYPPYLAYLYLIPFSILLGLQYFLNFDLRELLIPFITSDLSQFFLGARFIMILASLASIFLIYKIGKNIFSNYRIGLLSAFLLSTSLLHILLSITSRHWLVVSFFGLLILYIITNPEYESNKKYLYASIATGIGFGFSTIIIAYLALIVLWYILQENNRISKKRMASYIIVFGVLAAIPIIIYPQSLGFSGDVTTEAVKTIPGIVTSPILFLKPIALSEPILAFFSIIGLISLFLSSKKMFAVFFGLIYSYSTLFYLAFRFEHRFTAGLLPFITILAAYGIYKTAESIKKDWIYAILIAPLIFSSQLGVLLYKNDSRIIAREWIEKNIQPHEKILVYARLTRLSTDASAVEEQRGIDGSSLRKVDEAEEVLPENLRKSTPFHALNLYSVNNEQFFKNISEYASKNNYKYALISDEDFLWGREDFALMQNFVKSSALIKTFGSHQTKYSISITQLIGSPLGLFKLKNFGPPLSLYELSE